MKWLLRLWLGWLAFVAIFLAWNVAGNVYARNFTPQDFGSKVRHECLSLWRAMTGDDINGHLGWLERCMKKRGGAF